MKIALIIRPAAGEERMEEYRAAVSRLREKGHEVTPRITFEGGDGRRLARAAARARYDLVIAAGGDGTIHEVVNGIAGEDWQPRLGIVPAGTANDFAAGLDLPKEIAEAIRIAVTGQPLSVDIARANERYFINVSTGGFGAEATEATSAETKRRLGPLAYLITGVREFVELHPVRGVFRAEGEVLYEGEFMLFAVGNARQTGGGSFLTPRAEFGDGKLDVLIVPAMPRMDFLALLPDLRAGTHIQSPDVIYVQVPDLELEAEEILNVNADGEPLRERKIRYSLTDRPLSVMVP